MLKYPNLSDENLVLAIKQWLESGGSPHITHPDSGWSLFHYAADFQDLAAIDYLYELGCDLNVRDSYGQTPLHIAVDSEIDDTVQTDAALNFKVTQRLITLGADLTIQDNKGKTPLDWIDDYGEVARARYEEVLSQTA
jgi:ankyrin repeat protein